MISALSGRAIAFCGLLLAQIVVVSADTLTLQNGSIVRGRLISVDGNRIEFEEYRGSRGRVLRLDRYEVRRIDLDDDRGGFDDAFGRPGGGGSGGGPGRGPRPGMREREVTVSADVPWSDTGIDVRGGQTLYFEAQGRVRWGPDRRDGPEGENNSPRNPARPIPNRPAAALIGRVREGGSDIFFIGGSQGPIQIRGSGRLYLGINDDFLEDNSGSFRVVVHY